MRETPHLVYYNYRFTSLILQLKLNRITCLANTITYTIVEYDGLLTFRPRGFALLAPTPESASLVQLRVRTLCSNLFSVGFFPLSSFFPTFSQTFGIFLGLPFDRTTGFTAASASSRG